MRKLFPFVLITVWLCQSCGSEEPFVENTGSVSGEVLEKSTGYPIPVAVLTMDKVESVVTGTDGSFLFNDIEAGRHTLVCTKSGYKELQVQIDVLAGKSKKQVFALERLPALLTIDKKELDFADNEGAASLSFKMINNDYETLSYEVVSNCEWISSIEPQSGVLLYGKTVTIVVHINKDALSVGNNETTIVVVTDNGSAELTVKATKAAEYKPSVTMKGGNEINSTSICVYAEILDCGKPSYTSCGFVYSETPQPTHSNGEVVATSVESGQNEYSAIIDDLELGKEYYIKAFAENDLGIAYSANQCKLVVSGQLPKVSLGNFHISSADRNVLLQASVDFSGDPLYVEKGFLYSDELRNPTIENNKIVVAGNGEGVFEAVLGNIEFNRTYYVRAYAKSEIGIAYSSSGSLKINTIAPQVQTSSVKVLDREKGTITVNGKLVEPGVPLYSEVGFVYSKDTSTPTIYNTVVRVTPSTTGEITSTIDGLNNKYVYYVRAYIKNSDGVSYGQVLTVFEPEYLDIVEHNLMMPKSDAGKVDWETANKLCATSTYFGYSDWRLPTLSELSVIISSGYLRDGSFRWTSTSDANEDYHFRAGFSSGHLNTYSESNVYSHYVRCVRTKD